MNNGNIEFLNYIYQNAEMGKDTISQLINIVEDSSSFTQTLEAQLRGYNEVFDIARHKIEEANKTSQGIEFFEKFTINAMINFKTLINKTPSHIAEMLIQGSTMGIVDITKKLKEYKAASHEETSALAEKLLISEQHNIEELKKFL